MQLIYEIFNGEKYKKIARNILAIYTLENLLI